MRISDAFPSKYLKAGDLDGRTVKVTIKTVMMDTIGDDEKPILYFVDKEKGMVLNKTNANVIAQEFGDDTNEWRGGEIELFAAMVDFQGKTVEGLRCRIPRRRPTNGNAITSGRQPPRDDRNADPGERELERAGTGSGARPMTRHADPDDSDIPFAPEMRG